MIKGRETTVGYHCPRCGLSILNKINIFSMEGNLIKMKCLCGGSELVAQSMKNGKFKLTVPCILCPNSHSYTLSSKTFFEKEIFSFTCKFTAIDICFIGRSDKVFAAIKKNEEELMKTFAAYADENGGEYEEEDEYYYEYDESDESDEYGVFDAFDAFNEFEDFDDLDALDDLDDDDNFDDLEDQWQFNFNPGFTLHKNKDPEFVPEKPNKPIRDVKDVKDINESGAVLLRSYQITAQILDALAKLCGRKKVICKCGDFDGKILLTGNAVRIECQNCGSYREIKSSNAADADYLDGLKELRLDYDE